MAFNDNEKRTLWLTGVGHFGAHFAMLVFPTAAVAISQQEGIPLERVLGWSFVGYMIFGLGALPVGIVTDHMRARWVVRAGVLGLGPAMMAVSMVAPGPAMVWALGVVGAFASLYHPAGIGLLSRNVSARGEALGLNGIAGNVGIAAAPLAAGYIGAVWGWRTAYLVLGGVVLLAGLAVSILKVDEAPVGKTLRDEGQHEDGERLRLFLLLLVAMTLGGLSYRANTVAQPAYYAERIEFVAYGTATSMVYIMGTFGQYLGGRLSDRYDLRILYLVFHLLSLPFVLAMAVLSGAPLMMAAAAFIFFSIGMQPIENSLVARFTPDRWRSTGYGLKFSVVFGIGALSVTGVEYVIESHSLAVVFLGIAGVVLAIIATAAALAWRTRGHPIYNASASATIR